jgi:uncharacterized protein
MNSTEKNQVYNKIISFLKKYDVNKISVFGSFVKDIETSSSDIDILVEFSDDKSLLQFINIEQKLSEYIGIKVDLLTKSSISPYILKNIENDIKILYQ